MKKSFQYFVFIGVLFFSGSIIGQIESDIEKKDKEKSREVKKDTCWDLESVVNVGFNNVGLYNWSGGGQSTISLQGLVSFSANYLNKKTSWDNNLDLAFGVIKTGYGPKIPWFKNDDRIEVTSKIGRKASKSWYYSGVFNFRTQFTYGYNSTDELLADNYFSNFFSPAYSICALGFDYKPNDNFTCFVSPGTMKITFVINDSLSGIGAFGVNENKKIRAELGGYFKLAFLKKEPFNIKGLSFKTNLTLFSNYTNQPQNIDVTWGTLTSLKVGKVFSLTLSTYLIYDHDIDIARFENDGVTPIYYKNPNGTFYYDNSGNPIQAKGPITQFKEALGLGLSMNF